MENIEGQTPQENPNPKAATSWKRWLWRGALSVGIFFVLLFIILALALKVPAVQSVLVKYATAYIEKKTGEKARIGYFALDFPKTLVVGNLYLGRTDTDTLAYAQKLGVDIGIATLKLDEIDLSKVTLSHATINLLRPAGQTQFNYERFLDKLLGPSSPDTTSASSTPPILLRDIRLEQVRFRYEDAVLGGKLDVLVGKGATALDLYLDQGQYRFGKLELDNSRVSYIAEQPQPLPGEAAADTAAADTSTFQLHLPESYLRQVVVTYDDQVGRMRLHMAVDTLLADRTLFDLTKQYISFDSLYAGALDFAFEQLVVPPTPGPSQPLPALTAGWTVDAAKVRFRDCAVAYDDDNSAPVPQGIDYSHIHLTGLDLHARQLSAADSLIAMNILEARTKEQCGLEVTALRVPSLKLGLDMLDFSDFLLATPASRFQGSFSAQFGNLLTVADNLGAMALQADIQPSTLALSDAYYFAPDAVQGLPLSLAFGMQGKAQGRMDDLGLEAIRLTAARETELAIAGRVKGLPDPDALWMDLQLEKLFTTAADVMALAPKNSLPTAIALPPTLSAQGHILGGMRDLQAQLDAQAYGGSAALTASLADTRYDVALELDSLRLGQMMKDSAYGPLSLKCKVDGKGFDYQKDMDMVFSGVLQDASYQGKPYKNLFLSGSVRQGFMDLSAHMNQPHLAFNLDAQGSLRAGDMGMKAAGSIKEMDLYTLGLVPDSLSVVTGFYADVQGEDLRDLSAQVGLEHLTFTKHSTEIFPMGDVQFKMKLDSTAVDASLVSDLLDGFFKSNIPMDEVMTVLGAHFNNYFDTHSEKLQAHQDTLQRHADMTFGLKPKDMDLLTGGLIKGLDTLLIGDFNGSFSGKTDDFRFRGGVQKLRYTDIGIDSMMISMSADAEQLKSRAFVKRFVYGDASFPNLLMLASAQNNILDVSASGYNMQRDKWLDVGARVSSIPEGFLVRLKEEFIFNYERWEVSADHQIALTQGWPVVKDLVMKADRSGGGEISINTETQADTAYVVLVDGLDFGRLTKFADKEYGLVNGVLDMDARYVASTGHANATMDMQNLGFMQTVFGNLQAHLDNEQNLQQYQYRASMGGAIGEMALAGAYALNDTISPLAMDAQIDAFNFAPLEELAKEYVANLKGGCKGKISFKGGGSAPLQLGGRLRLNPSSMKILAIGNTLDLASGSLAFDRKGILFDNITAVDGNKRDAVLKGYIRTTDYSQFILDLKLLATDFELLNTTAADNPDYYGKLLVSTETAITGSMDSPVVRSRVMLKKGTDLTYVYSDEAGDVGKGDGVVNFLVKNKEGKLVQKKQETSAFMYDVDAAIIIDEATKARIIMDPSTGDVINVEGGGTLSLKMDGYGAMTLTGQYELSKGDYKVTLGKLIQKQFSVRPGSSVTFTGNPFNPLLNITALYDVKAAPLPIIAAKAGGSANLTQYNVKRNFEVLLNVKNQVESPEVSFGLDYPLNDNPKDNTIIAAVNQLNQEPSELNKQVFSLLTLGSFTDLSSSNSSSGDMGLNVAFSTASSLLNSQLNNLTSKIKGVDINVDLDSYQAGSSNRTDMGVSIRKQLFNNRLSVTVGGTVALAGQESQNAAQGNNFSTDFSIDYKLLKDGTLQLQVYRTNEAQNTNKMGLGVVFAKDYNRFRQLFIRNLDVKTERRRNLGRLIRNMDTSKDSTQTDSLKQVSPDAPQAASPPAPKALQSSETKKGEAMLLMPLYCVSRRRIRSRND